MPKLPPRRMQARLRPIALLSLGVLSLPAIPLCASAQTAPASLRACTAESDPARRLACYDRQMGRSSTPQPTSRAKVAPAAVAPAVVAPAAVTPAAPHSPDAASTRKPAAHWKAPWKLFAGGSSPRLTAHIIRLERSPDSMVLHLDNGQVWQQVGRASGDLSLREGDEVRIEEHLGGYWLSSRYVSDMQVRLKPGD
jgi:hypothetical protein